MMGQIIPFSPDWLLLPGESVLDMAHERGWKQVELAHRLECFVGGAKDFWLALETNYQKHKTRLEMEESLLN